MNLGSKQSVAIFIYARADFGELVRKLIVAVFECRMYFQEHLTRSVTDLPEGIYLIKIVTDLDEQIFKILKE